MKINMLIQGALTLSAPSLFAAEKPNILIFIADDHGFEQSQPYGSTEVRTPTMQRIADAGMVFDQAYVASPASGPSRGALLSGLMSARNGAISNHQTPSAESQTMVAELQAQGYEVAAFGKVAHSPQQAELCGFDYCDQKSGREALATSVEKYLSERESDKPLCLMVGDRRPHVPWTCENIYDTNSFTIPSHLIDTPETREYWAKYLSEITGMDATMGAVDELFTEYVGSEDYLFVYTADHGAQWAFGKWNLYERGVRTPLIMRWDGHIEQGVRTNAMVSWIDLMPTFIDLAGGESSDDIDGKSFAKVLENPKAKHRTEIYTTHTNDGRMNAYPIRALRDGDMKYIRNLNPDTYHSNHSDILRKVNAGAYWDSWDAKAKIDTKAAEIIAHYYIRPAEELYDLSVDPYETNNLASNPKYAKKKAKMSAKLDKWIAEQGDKMELPVKPYPISGPTPHIVNQK